MKRTISEQFLAWKASPERKPLVLKSVRQCGKTYILKAFGAEQYPDVAYFNFEESPALAALFEQDYDVKRILIELGLFRGQYVRPEEAISGILGSGGIPVLAHPFYGSGEELIVGSEMEARLQRLMGYGLRGIEAVYSGFPEKLRNAALSLAQRYDLFVTAGSDYHGGNKLVRLGDTGLDEHAHRPAGLDRFLERVGV